MKRRELFEFEDFRWFPSAIRQSMTAMIVPIHKLLGTEALVAPLVARAMKAGKTETIVDLCSGAGGAMPGVVRRLRQEPGSKVRATLTDMYPNHAALMALNAAGDASLHYRETPVDAGNVPPELSGVRTLVCGFHHMSPEVARRILKDAFDQRQPLCIFEISDNSQPVVAAAFAFFFSLLVSPLVALFARPLTWKGLFFTFVVPIIPVAYAWDATASNLRTYTADDLRELLRGLEATDYEWEVGALRKPGYPSGMPYVLGLPR